MVIMKVKVIYFLSLFLFPIASFACKCLNRGVVNDFQTSEFVATARILEISPDLADADYHNAVIQIINLYKGERLTKIKIASRLNTSCSFLPGKNSSWIIFAQREQGKLSFGLCSGSINIDRTVDNTKYPSADNNHKDMIAIKEGAIAFLNKNRIFNPNPSALSAYNAEIESFKGYRNKNSFAVFEVDVNSDHSIAGIKQLKKFQNMKLNRLVFRSMRTNLKLYGKTKQSGKLILFCFFYQEKGRRQSFLSFSDL